MGASSDSLTIARPRRRFFWLLAGALLAIAVAIAPRARGYFLHHYGPEYFEFKYYYWHYDQLSPRAVGNGSAPPDILLQDPMGIDVDAQGNIFLSDRGRFIWKFTDGEPAKIFAGTGRRGSAPHGIAALEAPIGLPEGICVDSQGRVLFADSFNNKVMRIERDGTLVAVAGNGRKGFSGDGGRATEAMLQRPYDVRTDQSGNVYIADFGNQRIRRVSPDGIITTVAEPARRVTAGMGGRRNSPG